MKILDRVQHNTFPPVTGTVHSIEPLPNNKYKVGVVNDETLTIFYDYIETWEPIDYTSNTYQDIYDVEVVSVQ